jgi:hypothetical protein
MRAIRRECHQLEDVLLAPEPCFDLVANRDLFIGEKAGKTLIQTV